MTSVTGHGAAAESYSGFAKFLHWVIAICVLVMIPVGVTMTYLEPGNLQNVLYTVHRSFGVLVLTLMIVRIVYRLIHGAPPPEPTLDPFQRIASHLVHMALYVLVTAQALIGWIATSAFGAPISFLGLFTVPALVEKDMSLATPLFTAHLVLAFLIGGLLVLHIGAALYHYVIRKDGVLQRMWP